MSARSSEGAEQVEAEGLAAHHRADREAVEARDPLRTKRQ